MQLLPLSPADSTVLSVTPPEGDSTQLGEDFSELPEAYLQWNLSDTSSHAVRPHLSGFKRVGSNKQGYRQILKTDVDRATPDWVPTSLKPVYTYGLEQLWPQILHHPLPVSAFLITALLVVYYFSRGVRILNQIRKDQKPLLTTYKRYKRKYPNPDVVFTFHSHDHEKAIHITNPFRGNLIVATPGSGKTVSLINPILQQAASANLAGLVFDAKYPNMTRQIRANHHYSGGKVWQLCLTDPLCSHRMNPIHPRFIRNKMDAQEMASLIISTGSNAHQARTDFWDQNCIAVIKATMLYLRNEHPDYCTIPHLVSFILEGTAEPLLMLPKLMSDEDAKLLITQSLGVALKMEAFEQFAGIAGTLLIRLQHYDDEVLYYVLSGDEVPFPLNKGKDVLVIGGDPAKVDVLAPLYSLIILTHMKGMNNPNQNPAYVLLDDAGYLPLPFLEKYAPLCRENKIAIFCAYQDESQLNAISPSYADTIKNALSNQFYGKPVLGETAGKMKVLAEAFGESINPLLFESGEFIGVLAEGKERYFHLELEEYKQKAPVRDWSVNRLGTESPTPEQLQENYRRIKQEVRDILTGIIPGRSASTTSETKQQEVSEDKDPKQKSPSPHIGLSSDAQSLPEPQSLPNSDLLAEPEDLIYIPGESDRMNSSFVSEYEANDFVTDKTENKPLSPLRQVKRSEAIARFMEQSYVFREYETLMQRVELHLNHNPDSSPLIFFTRLLAESNLTEEDKQFLLTIFFKEHRSSPILDEISQKPAQTIAFGSGEDQFPIDAIEGTVIRKGPRGIEIVSAEVVEVEKKQKARQARTKANAKKAAGKPQAKRATKKTTRRKPGKTVQAGKPRKASPKGKTD